jgi:Concanavalin A-like lectin/glucanases superfamily
MKNNIILLICIVATGFKSTAQQKYFYASFDADSAVGVKGKSKCFDGFFTSVEFPSGTLPNSNNLTVEAWVALQEYASNVAAIADKEKDFQQGYLFGINQYGKLSGSVAINDNWITIVSDQPVPLLRWTHVAMVLEDGQSLTLYINGRNCGRTALFGRMSGCDSCNLCIGKTQTKSTAANTERAASMGIKSYNHFDGLIDELFIHPNALTTEELVAKFSATPVSNPQPLVYRQMPSGPGTKGKFGAFYTKLKYSPSWDALWRGSDFPDVVVRFENSPVRFVFWRGTGYIPAVVNEKNMWMSDQSIEHYGTGECYEAMGDKQARYSHVRVLENTPARVVVHWRYALASITHQLLPEDEDGWSDWVDEYWTIYPDGIAARKQVLWSKRYEKDKGVMQWQETILFCQPGTKPEDNLDTKAITFMDMKGNRESYSWDDGPPKFTVFSKPAYQPIEFINFRSHYKPFNIFSERRICNPFSFGYTKGYTKFPNWNHWPVQQLPSDGRNAVAPDKPSHSSLTDGNGNTQIVEKKDDGSYWACMLKGMTDRPVDALLPLARSWNYAPAINGISAGVDYSYDKYQRAYLLTASSNTIPKIVFTVLASNESPLYNLPIVINNWQADLLKIYIDGKMLKEGQDFTIGNIPGLQTNQVVVFAKMLRTKPVLVVLKK